MLAPRALPFGETSADPRPSDHCPQAMGYFPCNDAR